MDSYTFKPDLCFHARCWWQIDGARIADGAWDTALQHLAPLWVRFESGDGDDGWMRTEPEGALEPSPSPPFRDVGILCPVLWFGVYHVRDLYSYEIRPAYFESTVDLWPRLEYVMAKDFGFIGMSGSPQAAGTENAPLWGIDGLDPRHLEVGQRKSNLLLFDPAGAAVRRYKQFGRPYLATHQGRRGALSLEVVGRPVPPHPRPLE